MYLRLRKYARDNPVLADKLEAALANGVLTESVFGSGQLV